MQEKEARRAAAARGDARKEHGRPGASLLQAAQLLLSPVFVEAFVLTFLAEWGDRSQIATIGMRERRSDDSFMLQFRAVLSACFITKRTPAPSPAGLAASTDRLGVTLGGNLGHMVLPNCT